MKLGMSMPVGQAVWQGVAVVAALGLDQRLGAVQRRVAVGKVPGVVVGAQAAGFQIGKVHGDLPRENSQTLLPCKN
jgi:hypothetical protein